MRANNKGIYALKHRGNIIYIGSSKNILYRIGQHMNNIKCRTTKIKYEYIEQYKDEIEWEVLSNVLSVAVEAEYIRKHRPILNTTFNKDAPNKQDNYRKKKPVINIETGEVYESARETFRILNISSGGRALMFIPKLCWTLLKRLKMI